MEVAPVAIAVVDRQGLVVAVNRALTDMLGYEREELVGLEVEALVPTEARDGHRDRRRAYAGAAKIRAMGHGLELQALHKDGASVPVEIGLSPVEVDGVELVMAVIVDITERKRLQAAVAQSERRHRGVLDHAPDGFFMADADGCLIETNLAYQRMSGYTAEALRGMCINDLNAFDRRADTRERIDAIVRTGAARFETWHRRQDGTTFPVEVAASVVPELGEIFVFVRDISRRKKADAEREALAQRIHQFAFTDVLTGLPNRRLFMDRLAQALEAARRHGGLGAVLFIDMDRFKALNDKLGHAAGDRFLVEVATRLRNSARLEDTVARLGGDEFVVILIGLDRQADVAASHTRTHASKIAARLGEPYAIDNTVHLSSASIGATLFPLPGDTVDAVLHRADQAMYGVKVVGGGGCRIEPESVQRLSNGCGGSQTPPSA
jgi:diguanylate cyclase (GGDEF)-like protein/PAS domain S-box-containing protein